MIQQWSACVEAHHCLLLSVHTEHNTVWSSQSRICVLEGITLQNATIDHWLDFWSHNIDQWCWSHNIDQWCSFGPTMFKPQTCGCIRGPFFHWMSVIACRRVDWGLTAGDRLSWDWVHCSRTFHTQLQRSSAAFWSLCYEISVRSLHALELGKHAIQTLMCMLCPARSNNLIIHMWRQYKQLTVCPLKPCMPHMTTRSTAQCCVVSSYCHSLWSL